MEEASSENGIGKEENLYGTRERNKKKRTQHTNENHFKENK